MDGRKTNKNKIEQKEAGTTHASSTQFWVQASKRPTSDRHHTILGTTRRAYEFQRKLYGGEAPLHGGVGGAGRAKKGHHTYGADGILAHGK